LKFALITLIIRVAFPVIAISNEVFYSQFLAPQFNVSSGQLQTTSDELQALQKQTSTPQSTATQQGFIENAKKLFTNARDTLDIEQQLGRFKAAAEKISEHTIKLMGVLIVQTVIVPLFSLWLALRFIQWVATLNLTSLFSNPPQ
jgi:hypothetical protein